MGENCDIESHNEEVLCRIPDEAVDAVARSMYGEAEYDALGEDSQAKDGYRKRAKTLLGVACEAAAVARARTEAQTGAFAIETTRTDNLGAGHTHEPED